MIQQNLRNLRPCEEGLKFAESHSSLQAAWDSCERGDWMLWLLGRIQGFDRKTLVRTACECARLSLRHMPQGEDRPRKAIETAEAWCDGQATLDEVKAAAAAAASAADSAAYAADSAAAAAAASVAYHAAKAAAAAYHAANAAAYAANAVARAAYAAAYHAAARAAYAAAYHAANAAADSAANAAYHAASAAILKECADIVRKHVPKCPRIRL